MLRGVEAEIAQDTDKTQTMRGCIQECMGCEAKSEFKVAPFDMNNLSGIIGMSESIACRSSKYQTLSSAK